MNEAQIIGLSLGLAIILVFLIIIFIKANIILCQPNELVVVAGKEKKKGGATSRGYRVIKGGRGFKKPLMESVARLSLNTMAVDLHLTKVMCLGMIPIEVEGRATVKLAGDEKSGMEAAIERFLGKGPDVVSKTAKQALEGALRGVIATVTPEEANMNRLDLAARASDQARTDLERLGIVLDYLQIHEITDSQGYLEAIGRKQSAKIQRDARIAEATADAEARKVAAEQGLAGREAEITADLVVVEKENSLEVKRSELTGKANEAKEEANVAGHLARVKAEIDVETHRVELNEKKTQADVVVPAKARMEADRLAAQGAARQILEDGKATAEAIESMRAQWDGGDSKDLFMIRMMPELMDKVTRVVADNLRVDKLTILDGGNGDGLPQHVNGLTKSAVSMIEQLGNATGIDINKLGNKRDSGPHLPSDLS
jgi:flotillin